MSVEEPPPVTSVPSTSTWNSSMTSSSSSSPSLSLSRRNSTSAAANPWTLSLDFGRLSLELREGRYQQHASPGPQSPRITNTHSIISNSMPAIAKKRDFYRCPPHKTGRFRPYEVPFEHRHRKRTKSTTKKAKKTGIDMEILLKIKLKGDVEPLKMCIFDREKAKSSSSKPCSVQAVCPPTPPRPCCEPNEEEIDELSEYFTHFVRVELKMSALAESMYV